MLTSKKGLTSILNFELSLPFGYALWIFLLFLIIILVSYYIGYYNGFQYGLQKVILNL